MLDYGGRAAVSHAPVINNKAEFMKTLLLALIAAGTLSLAAGCATSGYSGGFPTIQFPGERATGENANNIARAWYIDSRSLADDINAVLLLDEPSDLTNWNAR